jgi:hypothetical protein
MRRKIWMILLGIGTVAGFASGFRSVHHFMGPHGPEHGEWGSRRAAFEAHIADVCTRSAERTLREHAPAGPRPAPPP